MFFLVGVEKQFVYLTLIINSSIQIPIISLTQMSICTMKCLVTLKLFTLFAYFSSNSLTMTVHNWTSSTMAKTLFYTHAHDISSISVLFSTRIPLEQTECVKSNCLLCVSNMNICESCWRDKTKLLQIVMLISSRS